MCIGLSENALMPDIHEMPGSSAFCHRLNCMPLIIHPYLIIITLTNYICWALDSCIEFKFEDKSITCMWWTICVHCLISAYLTLYQEFKATLSSLTNAVEQSSQQHYHSANPTLTGQNFSLSLNGNLWLCRFSSVTQFEYWFAHLCIWFCDLQHTSSEDANLSELLLVSTHMRTNLRHSLISGSIFISLSTSKEKRV